MMIMMMTVDGVLSFAFETDIHEWILKSRMVVGRELQKEACRGKNLHRVLPPYLQQYLCAVVMYVMKSRKHKGGAAVHERRSFGHRAMMLFATFLPLFSVRGSNESGRTPAERVTDVQQ